MKSSVNGDVFRTPLILNIAAVFVVAVTFFYLGKHWSDGYEQLIFFTSNREHPVVSSSPNLGKLFNVSDLINQTQPMPDKTVAAPSTSLPIPQDPIPPPPATNEIKKFGIVNDDGTMSENFEVGEFDPELVDKWVNETQVEADGNTDSGPQFAIKKFGLCPSTMSEYIPCLDNVEAIKKLKSTERGERFERYCPEEGQGLNCLVPAPEGYRTPIPWPRSRDEVLNCYPCNFCYLIGGKNA